MVWINTVVLIYIFVIFNHFKMLPIVYTKWVLQCCSKSYAYFNVQQYFVQFLSVTRVNIILPLETPLETPVCGLLALHGDMVFGLLVLLGDMACGLLVMLGDTVCCAWADLAVRDGTVVAVAWGLWPGAMLTVVGGIKSTWESDGVFKCAEAIWRVAGCGNLLKLDFTGGASTKGNDDKMGVWTLDLM